MSDLETNVALAQAGVDATAHNREIAKQKENETVEYPGKINVSIERGHASGCSCLIFTDSAGTSAAAKMNEFFLKNPNMLVVHVQFSSAAIIGGEVLHSILVLYTKVLSSEEIERVNRFGILVREKMAEEDEKQEAARAKQEEARIDREKEERELVKVGKVCKENHGGLVEELRKLKKGKGT